MDCQLETWTIETDNDEEFVKKIKEIAIIDDVVCKEKSRNLKPNNNQRNIYYGSSIGTWILKTSKPKHSFFEKYIYDTVLFHFKRLGLTFNEKNHKVQFWLNSENKDFVKPLHVDFYADYNRRMEEHCCFSTVSYFDNNDTSTLFTDLRDLDVMCEDTNEMSVDEDFINKKNFNHLNRLCFSLPKKLKHAFFLGKKYFHGHWKTFEKSTVNSERLILVLKTWENFEPDFIDDFDNEYYDLKEEYNKNDPSIVNFSPLNNTKYIYMKDDSLINDVLFKSLINPEAITQKEIYKKLCFPFGDLILKNGYNKHDTFIFEINPEKYENDVKQKQTEKYRNYYLYTLIFILLVGFVYYLYKIPDLFMFLYNSILTRNNEDISISILKPL